MGRTPERNVQLGGVDLRGRRPVRFPWLCGSTSHHCLWVPGGQGRQKETETEGPKANKEVGQKGG